MRTILLIIVVLALAFVGYEYGYKGRSAPQNIDQATQQVNEAAKDAAAAGRDAAAQLQQGADKLKDSAKTGNSQ